MNYYNVTDTLNRISVIYVSDIPKEKMDKIFRLADELKIETRNNLDNFLKVSVESSGYIFEKLDISISYTFENS